MVIIGPNLIVYSSAGSGKTSYIIRQIKKLLKLGVNPKKILIIAYSNSAINTLQERLPKNYSGDLYSLHSFCFQYLKTYIYSDSYTLYERKWDFSNLLPFHLQQKNHIITHLLNHNYEKIILSYLGRHNAPINDKELLYLEDYNNLLNFKKTQINVLFFEDIIIDMYLLLISDNRDFHLMNICNSIDHIFIDEAQDFSPMQLEIIYFIIREKIFNNYMNSTFTIMGDPKQSIFNFQGSIVEVYKYKMHLITNLCHDHKTDLKVFNINTTYRCKERVIQFINDFFININLKYFRDHLSCHGGGNVFLHHIPITFNYSKLIHLIVDIIIKLINSGINENNICILYHRRTYIIDLIHDAIKLKNIQSAGNDVFSTKNIIIDFIHNIMELIISIETVEQWKKIIGTYFLPLLVNNYDNSLIIISLEEIYILLARHPITKNLLNLIKKLKDEYLTYSMYDFLHLLLKKNIITYLLNEYSDQRDFFDKLLYESRIKTNINMKDFMDTLPNNFKKDPTQGIQFSTIHSAKGRQFHSTIIIDSHLNHLGNTYETHFIWNDFNKDNIVEEYKRLMYVAFTRCKENLFILGYGSVNPQSMLWYLYEYSSPHTTNIIKNMF